MSKHGSVVARTKCSKCAEGGRDGSGDNLVVYESGYAKCFNSECGHFTYDNYDKSIKVEQKKLKPIMSNGLVSKALESRGITRDTCRHYGYSIKEIGGQEFHAMNYNSIGQKFRTPDKEFFWRGDRAAMSTFFGQNLYSGGKKLAITEGEIDAMSVGQVMGINWPCVSLPNGADSIELCFKENIQWLKGFDEIVLFMDNDAAGRAAESKANEILPGRLKAARLPDGFSDANDLLVAGRAKDIQRAFWNAADIREDDGVLDIGDVTWDQFSTSLPEGMPYIFPGLTKAVGGLRPARLDLYAAGSGCGKSTFVKEICYDNIMRSEDKWGLIFMEEQDIDTIQSMIAYKLGVKLPDLRENPTAYATEEQFYAARDEMAGRIDIMKHAAELKYSELVNKIEYLAKARGCKYIVLDHISMAVAGSDVDDERKAIDSLMKDLYSIIDRTGVGIHAIVHLKNLEGGRDWTDGVIPKKSHLRGSGGLAQMSYNIITLSRDTTCHDKYDRLATYIHVQKCRERGESTGLCTDRLQYNEKTGRLDPVEMFPDCPHGKTKNNFKR